MYYITTKLCSDDEPCCTEFGAWMVEGAVAMIECRECCIPFVICAGIVLLTDLLSVACGASVVNWRCCCGDHFHLWQIRTKETDSRMLVVDRDIGEGRGSGESVRIQDLHDITTN